MKKVLSSLVAVLFATSCLATSVTADEESCGSVRFEPAEAFGFKTTTDIIQDLVLGLQANYKIYLAAKQKGDLLGQVNAAGQQSVMLDSIKEHLSQLRGYQLSQEQLRQIQLAETFVQERKNEFFNYFICLSDLFDPNPQQ